MIAIDPGAKPGIPGAPRATRRWRFGQVAYGLSRWQRPRATGRQLRGAFFRQPPRGAAAMGRAGLAVLAPALLDAGAIADRDALPSLNQGGQGFWRALGMQAIERHGSGAQGPEPVPGILAVPGRRIDSAAGGLAGQRGDGLIVRHEGVRASVNDLWPRLQAEGDGQAGVAEVLEAAACGAVPAGAFTHERRQARAITRLRLAWSLGFERPAPAAPGAWRRDERRDVPLDRWQLENSVGVLRRTRHQRAVAARPGTGRKQGHRGRTAPRGTLAGGPLAAASLPCGRTWVTLGLVAGGGRRWRLTGGLRRFLHPALPGGHWWREVCALLMQALAVIVDGAGGVSSQSIGQKGSAHRLESGGA